MTRPHFKWGRLHRFDCRCRTCRMRRRSAWADRLLKRLGDAERRVDQKDPTP